MERTLDEAPPISTDLLLTLWSKMTTAAAMTKLYEAQREVTAKYVHATSRGHEAIQLAVGLQLAPQDYAYPYYRDDAMLLGMGLEPYELMLQLLARKDDPFSGGRTYYSHPSLKREGFTKIPHNSSATGMQAIPSAGAALGLKYLEQQQLVNYAAGEAPLVLCSIGDAAVTEGEISEALQMAALKQLPYVFLVQDNEWDISASADEVRANDAAYYARGFEGLSAVSIDGSNAEQCWNAVAYAFKKVREERSPILLHARVPLLNHHTSGVRLETYRDDLEAHQERDPLPRLEALLKSRGIVQEELDELRRQSEALVKDDYRRATEAPNPEPQDLFTHAFAPTPITEERGERSPQDAEVTLMVDCALFAVQELLEDHPEALLYGQDVGHRLGGVFREAATLAKKFGVERVFNTPIMEAFIIGSTAGMSAVGCRPIVEVQFADYIWPGLNQLFTELSRSCYLSDGKWPVSSVIRVPIGAYGSGGPYHSSSIESVVSNIRGIKVLYPSCGADLKGLMKAAFYDPNPVVILEHKGLYWSKIKGTAAAKSKLPSRDYVVPIGKGRIVKYADEGAVNSGRSTLVVSYGMGVYWALEAAVQLNDRVEVLDLRSLSPWDEELVYSRCALHGRCMVLTEEPSGCSYAAALAGHIQRHCFAELDAPVLIVAAEDLPAIPLNEILEQTMIPSAAKVKSALEQLLAY